MNGNTCASSVAGCAGQWHLRGPDSVPHKLPFSQEAAAARGTQLCRRTPRAHSVTAGLRARILTRAFINAESLGSSKTLLTFKDT